MEVFSHARVLRYMLVLEVVGCPSVMSKFDHHNA